MTKIVFYRSNGFFYGFEEQGHTGYGEAGDDILCSALSAMTMLIINTIEVSYDCVVDYNIDDFEYNQYLKEFMTSFVTNFAEYVTNDWLGTIYVGDFLHKGLFHYDETADCWYDEDEVVPLDFDLMSILYKKALTLSVYKLTHNFNYMTLIEDLFLGNTMALTRYMELQFGSDPIIYVDAERTYTLDADGNEVKFPYEIHMLDAEYYYTKDGWDYPLEIKKSIWYETKLFEHQFNVDVAKDENGVYTVPLGCLKP